MKVRELQKAVKIQEVAIRNQQNNIQALQKKTQSQENKIRSQENRIQIQESLAQNQSKINLDQGNMIKRLGKEYQSKKVRKSGRTLKLRANTQKTIMGSNLV